MAVVAERFRSTGLNPDVLLPCTDLYVGRDTNTDMLCMWRLYMEEPTGALLCVSGSISNSPHDLNVRRSRRRTRGSTRMPQAPAHMRPIVPTYMLRQARGKRMLWACSRTGARSFEVRSWTQQGARRTVPKTSSLRDLEEVPQPPRGYVRVWDQPATPQCEEVRTVHARR